eukprot:1330440-Amphidinium_carterae.1
MTCAYISLQGYPARHGLSVLFAPPGHLARLLSFSVPLSILHLALRLQKRMHTVKCSCVSQAVATLRVDVSSVLLPLYRLDHVGRACLNMALRGTA